MALRRISRAWAARVSVGSIKEAALPVGASLLVPLFAATALSIPVDAIDGIMSPLLGDSGPVLVAESSPSAPDRAHATRALVQDGRRGIGGAIGWDATVRVVLARSSTKMVVSLPPGAKIEWDPVRLAVPPAFSPGGRPEPKVMPKPESQTAAGRGSSAGEAAGEDGPVLETTRESSPALGASGSEQPRTLPGRSGGAPGKGGLPPGQEGTGQSGGGGEGSAGESGSRGDGGSEARGRSEDAPGRIESAPGRAAITPGLSGSVFVEGSVSPGQSGTTPGRSGSTPGQSGSAPGRSGRS